MVSERVRQWEALTAGQRLDVLAELDSKINAVQGERAMLLAVMARLDNDPVGVAGGGIADPVIEEVALTSHVSPARAGMDVVSSQILSQRLPRVLGLVAEGRVALFTAQAVAELLPMEVDPSNDPTPVIEERILSRLEGRTVAQVRQSMRRIVARVMPEYAKRRCAQAKAGREVRLRPLPDGMMQLCATLPAAHAQYVYEMLDTAAREQRKALKAAKAAGHDVDVIGVGALRADALVAFATHIHTTGLPGWNARPALNVAVIVDLPTLLGLAHNPGEIPGYGPIPAQAARELAADGRWGKWLIDDDTHLLSAGKHTYTPSTALARFIRARDQHCRFPNCQSLATSPTAEIDHANPFNHHNPEHGGTTEPANLGILCKRHHQLKTAGVWTITESKPDGSCQWQSPTGRRYTVRGNAILTLYDDLTRLTHLEARLHRILRDCA